MKFAHMGDCHLGGWRQPELNQLNMQSFARAIDICIKQKVEFILISGDLLDSAYPSIESLKETFFEFRRLKDANIPVFIIAGSHDYSVSGKTFLDVLEKGGFCKNVFAYEERNDYLYLHPTLWKNVAIYGYPGKKSGLEVDDISRIKLHDAPGLFKILMLHTTIEDAIGTLPIKAVNHKLLPNVDYLALSHLHIPYQKENRVYSGPIFPNNLAELEELKHGFFYIFDNGKIKKEDLKIKETLVFDIEIIDAFGAGVKIIDQLKKQDIRDKVVILKIRGILSKGKTSDLDFADVEKYANENGAYVLLRSTSKLHMQEPQMEMETLDTESLEDDIIEKFCISNPGKYTNYVHGLIRTLQSEKNEDEKASVFEERIFSEVKKILSI